MLPGNRWGHPHDSSETLVLQQWIVWLSDSDKFRCSILSLSFYTFFTPHILKAFRFVRLNLITYFKGLPSVFIHLRAEISGLKKNIKKISAWNFNQFQAEIPGKKVSKNFVLLLAWCRPRVLLLLWFWLQKSLKTWKIQTSHDISAWKFGPEVLARNFGQNFWPEKKTAKKFQPEISINFKPKFQAKKSPKTLFLFLLA